MSDRNGVSLGDLERRRWTVNDLAIVKTWRFGDWRQALVFVERVLDRGTRADLRPTVSICQRRVTVRLEAELGDDFGPAALAFAAELDHR